MTSAPRTQQKDHPSSVGRLRRIWQKLTAPPGELTRADLQQVADDAGAQPIGKCKDREKVTLGGTITAVEQCAQGETPKLVLTLRDDSGTIKVAWIGRRSIPGVETGRRVLVHGRVSCRDGQRVMYNPRYELIDG